MLNADAVLNHLNFCMMATALTWIYADRLQYAPDRKVMYHRQSRWLESAGTAQSG
jgi:hypothetical protein